MPQTLRRRLGRWLRPPVPDQPGIFPRNGKPRAGVSRGEVAWQMYPRPPVKMQSKHIRIKIPP